MKDVALLIQVSTLFILLGITLPFYLPSDWGLLPLGMSFLADGIVLLFISIIAWVYEMIHKAREEDKLTNWLLRKEEAFENIDYWTKP